MLLSSRPQHHRSHTQRGFTLVEILLVVVIVGVMAGLATLAIGSNGPRQLQQEAVRLHQRLLMAQDEAAFGQKNLGLRFTETGYQLLQYDAEDDVWLPLQNNVVGQRDNKDGKSTSNISDSRTDNHIDNYIDDHSSLIRDSGVYEYAVPVTVSLELAGAPLAMPRQRPSSDYSLSDSLGTRESEDRKNVQPALLLLANGESSPFTLTIQLQSDPRSVQTLHSDGFSPIVRSSHTSNR